MMDWCTCEKRSIFIQYHDDNVIRGYASTSAVGAMQMPVYQAVDGFIMLSPMMVPLFACILDGKIVSETSHSGYLAWGDGSDHNLYLNRYTVDDDWKARQFTMI